MCKIGAKRNMPVVSCQSCEQFRDAARWIPHDVAILDYYLDGNRTARQIARDCPSRALIIVSNDEAELAIDNDWPPTVKIALSKAMGIAAILDAACAVSER